MKLLTKNDPEYWETLAQILKGEVSLSKKEKEVVVEEVETTPEVKAKVNPPVPLPTPSKEDMEFDNFSRTMEGEMCILLSQFVKLITQAYYKKAHIAYAFFDSKDRDNTFVLFSMFLNFLKAPKIKTNMMTHSVYFENGSIIHFKVEKYGNWN